MDNPKKNEMERKDKKPAKRVILLEDLDGDDDVVGGAGQKLFFGESVSPLPGFPPSAGGSSSGSPQKS